MGKSVSKLIGIGFFVGGLAIGGVLNRWYPMRQPKITVVGGTVSNALLTKIAARETKLAGQVANLRTRVSRIERVDSRVITTMLKIVQIEHTAPQMPALPVSAALPTHIPPVPPLALKARRAASPEPKPGKSSDASASSGAGSHHTATAAFSIVGIKAGRLYYQAPDQNIHVADKGGPIFGLDGRYLGPGKPGEAIVEFNGERHVLPAKNLENPS